MACSVHENSRRASPASIVEVQPKALGRIRNTISEPTPSDVQAQSSAPAMVANIASGTGRPGWSRFQRAKCETISPIQIHEPTTAIRTPR